MQRSHKLVTNKYDQSRIEARDIAHKSLPSHLRQATNLEPINNSAIVATKLWGLDPERMVEWDWNFANRYTYRYPKAFDLAVWVQNKLCSLSLGRPSYKGTFMRLDFIEKAPENNPFSKDMLGISLLAYETYARLIGAQQLRIIDPINEKVVRSYLSQGGFSYSKGKKGNPHFLVKDL